MFFIMVFVSYPSNSPKTVIESQLVSPVVSMSKKTASSLKKSYKRQFSDGGNLFTKKDESKLKSAFLAS